MATKDVTVAVIGAGNGGMAISAHLASCGIKVNICDLFPKYVADLKATKEVKLTYNGKTTIEKLNKVTDSVEEAIAGTQLIMVVTPSFTHRMIAEACWKYLEDGQVVVLNPGRTGGALDFYERIHALGCDKDITVCETSTLIYSCRKTDSQSVEIYGIKDELLFGVIPSNRVNQVIELIKPFYPQFKAAKNCLETSFSNIGALFHPTPMLLNIGRIESDERGYRYYVDGISPSVSRLVHEVDKERMAVADAFGIKVLSAEEWLVASYETHGKDLYEMIQNNGAYADIMAPKTIDARYVTEDVPMSLVPISELATVVNVPTPNIDAIIQLTSAVYNKNFREEGRTLGSMGLQGLNKEQIENFFVTGKR